MKEDILKKIHRMGHIGQVITLIVKILVGIGLVLCIIGTILAYRVPDDFVTLNVDGQAVLKVDLEKIGQTAKSINLSDNDFDLNVLTNKKLTIESSDVSVDGNVINAQVTAKGEVLRNGVLKELLIPATAKVLLTFICAFMVGMLCKAIRYCESPFDENVIKRMRILAFSLLPWTIIDSISNSIFQGPHLELNLAMIIPVFIIFILVRIFRYGAILQQESDETL